MQPVERRVVPRRRHVRQVEGLARGVVRELAREPPRDGQGLERLARPEVGAAEAERAREARKDEAHANAREARGELGDDGPRELQQ
jgi:hypothetical protein